MHDQMRIISVNSIKKFQDIKRTQLIPRIKTTKKEANKQETMSVKITGCI